MLITVEEVEKCMPKLGNKQSMKDRVNKQLGIKKEDIHYTYEKMFLRQILFCLLILILYYTSQVLTSLKRSRGIKRKKITEECPPPNYLTSLLLYNDDLPLFKTSPSFYVSAVHVF